MNAFRFTILLVFCLSFSSQAQVVADFSYSGTLCANSTISFSNLSSGASAYEWDFGDFNTSTQTDPNHTFNFKNVYTVRLIARAGAQRDTIEKFVFIDAASRAFFFLNKFNGQYCEGAEVAINNNSQNYSSLHWDFGDGDTSNLQNVNHTWPSGAGSYTVVLKTFGVCGNDSSSRTIDFSNNSSLAPRAGLTFQGNVFCPGDAIEFLDFSQDEDSLHFFFDDGTSAPGPRPSHANPIRVFTIRW